MELVLEITNYSTLVQMLTTVDKELAAQKRLINSDVFVIARLYETVEALTRLTNYMETGSRGIGGYCGE